MTQPIQKPVRGFISDGLDFNSKAGSFMTSVTQNGAAEKPILQSAAATLPAAGNLYGGPRIADLDIGAVWTALGGPPSVRNRSVAWYRGGRGLNIQLYPDSGAWKDFKTGEAGGILAMVERVLGCGRRGAIAWLADNFGIAYSERTPSERRDYSRRLEWARLAAAALVARRDEAFNFIREAKRQKLEEYHRLNCAAHEAEDIELLAAAEDVWALLEALDVEGDALLSETDSAKLAAMLAERGAA